MCKGNPDNDFYFEDLGAFRSELARKTVAQQKAKREAYNALKAAGFPIPPDLRKDVEDGEDDEA